MKKEKIHISLITNSNREENNLLGEYNREKKIIEYYESNSLRSKITIDLSNHLLIKDNIDYRITLNLDVNNKSSGEILLKKENKILNLEIETSKFELKDNKVTMKYIIIDSKEEIIYEIEMGD